MIDEEASSLGQMCCSWNRRNDQRVSYLVFADKWRLCLVSLLCRLKPITVASRLSDRTSTSLGFRLLSLDLGCFVVLATSDARGFIPLLRSQNVHGKDIGQVAAQRKPYNSSLSMIGKFSVLTFLGFPRNVCWREDKRASYLPRPLQTPLLLALITSYHNNGSHSRRTRCLPFHVQFQFHK